MTDDNRPEPPAWLDEIGKAYYLELAQKVAELPEFLPKCDGPALSLAAEAYSTFRRADELVQQQGLTTTSTNRAGFANIVQHPAFRTRNEALRRLRDALDALLLSPKSRRRVGRPVKQLGDDDDGFAQFIG